LDQGEIDRMIREAEANAAEDKRHKQEAETRNEADALSYQVNRQLKDLGDKIPVHEKARIEQLLNVCRRPLKIMYLLKVSVTFTVTCSKQPIPCPWRLMSRLPV